MVRTGEGTCNKKDRGGNMWYEGREYVVIRT